MRTSTILAFGLVLAGFMLSGGTCQDPVKLGVEFGTPSLECNGKFEVRGLRLSVTNTLNEAQNIRVIITPGGNTALTSQATHNDFFGAGNTKAYAVEGRLNDPCHSGSVSATARGEKGGEGTAPLSIQEAPIKGQAPEGVTPDQDGNYKYGRDSSDPITLECCAANRVLSLAMEGGSNVTNTTVDPTQVTCSAPGPVSNQPKVTGTLIDKTQKGLSNIRIRQTSPTSPHTCNLPTEVEPAQ